MRSSIILFTLCVGLVQWVAAVGFVGSLRTYWHKTAGDVSIVSPSQIKISGFTYDGQGAGGNPVYFTAAKQRPYKGPQGEANRIPLTSTGPLNGRPHNNEEIIINLPANLNANDIKWLSLWCNIFKIDFGSVEFSVPS